MIGANPTEFNDRLLIVSNRLPVTISCREGRADIVPSGGGLATGLGSVRARRGQGLREGDYRERLATDGAQYTELVQLLTSTLTSTVRSAKR